MQPNEQPINTAPIASPVIDAPQKNSKNRGLIIALIICIILACGGVGFGLYEYFKNRNQANTPQTTNTPANDQNANNTPATDIDTSMEDVQTVVDLIADNVSSLSSNIVYDKSYNNTPSGRIIVGDDVVTSADKSIGFKLNEDYVNSTSEPKANMVSFDDIRNTITNTLINNNFTPLFVDGFGDTLFYKSTKNIYCELPSSMSLFMAFLSCASGSWISPERAELTIAIEESLGRTDSHFNFVYATTADIEDSSIAPYQRLAADGFNAKLLLYRVSEDSEWHFITATQVSPDCDKFNDDAKKAYAGTKCRTADFTEITL